MGIGGVGGLPVEAVADGEGATLGDGEGEGLGEGIMEGDGDGEGLGDGVIEGDGDGLGEGLGKGVGGAGDTISSRGPINVYGGSVGILQLGSATNPSVNAGDVGFKQKFSVADGFGSSNCAETTTELESSPPSFRVFTWLDVED